MGISLCVVAMTLALLGALHPTTRIARLKIECAGWQIEPVEFTLASQDPLREWVGSLLVATSSYVCARSLANALASGIF